MLTIDRLRKAYGSTRALDDVTLTVRPGEMVGFVGANGAGKSTTMRIAMGLLAADSGTVCWQDQPLTFAVRRRFGYMPEERGLYPKMRVVEQIAYFGQLRGMPAHAANRAAATLVETMGVKAAPRDYVQALSLGNQQRVQLAAALVHDPELLILDEPFSGLDPVGVDTMAEVLAQRRREQGTGVLFSSHQLELVERVCDRVIIVRDGHIVADGTLDELRGAAARDELQVRVEAVDASWVPAGATVLRRDDDTYVLRLADPEDDQQVLAAATGAGRVEQFGWRTPSLVELYRDAVTGS